jgi:polysaccharide biosynthesis protein PslH
VNRILVVSVEAPWPQHHGGRIRTASVAEALAAKHEVIVAFPSDGDRRPDPGEGLSLYPMEVKRPWPLVTRVSRKPHLGGCQLRSVLPVLARLIEQVEPHLVYWSHSYLAAWGMHATRALPNVVEFANIETARLRTLVGDANGIRRLARRIEAAKSVRWEPAVARAASLCVALSPADHHVVQEWGADVVTVPNGIRAREYRPSPRDGYILAMASYDYGPNREAIHKFVQDSWPAIRGALPATKLVVAGRGSEDLTSTLGTVGGVEVRGTVADVDECYDAAAVTLAPALTGGGSQLKITESFSYGRCCVGSGFSERSVPPELHGTSAFVVADTVHQYADSLVKYVSDPLHRWATEEHAWHAVQPMTWGSRTRPLLDQISLMTHRRRRAG